MNASFVFHNFVILLSHSSINIEVLKLVEVQMSRKMIFKLVIDFIMTIIMIVLMGYQVTGNQLHEILGMTIFLLFILHCALNRIWFINLFNLFKNLKKNKVSLIWTLTNLLLMIDMLVLVVSSVMISRQVFAGLGISFNRFWAYLHEVCAYGGFIIMSIHLGFHWKMIMGGIKRSLHIQGDNVLRNICLKALALLMVIAGVKGSFDKGIGSKFIPAFSKAKAKATSDVLAADTSQNTKHDKKNSENRTFTETIQENQSLNDFLGSLTCTGCGKQCSLLSPRCNIGENQAATATTYYNSYDTSDSESTNVTESTENTIILSNNDNSLLELFMDYVPIMGLYVAGTYYTLKFVNRRKKTE